MKMDDVLEIEQHKGSCWVCGKGIEEGKGHARIKHGDKVATLCSAECEAKFRKDPEHYAARRDAQRLLREVTSKPAPKGGASSKRRR